MNTILIQNRTNRTEAETLRNFLIGNQINVSSCRICKEENIKPYIHHLDGNKLNNSLFNLAVLCFYCHFAIHFKPNLLIKRNKTIIKELITGKSKSEEHKRKMSLAKKGKTYEEIYGNNGIIKAKNQSVLMKTIVNNYKRNDLGRFNK